MFSYFQKQFTKTKPENIATVPEIIGQRYSREARRRLSGECRRGKMVLNIVRFWYRTLLIEEDEFVTFAMRGRQIM